MLDIALNNSNYSIRTTMTAAALHVGSITGPGQLPVEYHVLPYSIINQRPWEEQYLPKALNENHGKIEKIYKFAVNLLQDSEDIPAEFAKVLNENFWEII